MTPVGAPSLEVLASWTLSPNQMRWSQSQVSGVTPQPCYSHRGSRAYCSLCVCQERPPLGGPTLFFILWVRPPEMLL